MELIFIAIIVLIATILIFKLIKKLVVAAFTFLMMIVLVLAGVGGLIYYDITSLANKEEFILHSQLKDSNQIIAGFTLPFENQSAKYTQVSGFDNSQEINNESEYLVTIKEESFYNLVRERTISFDAFSFSALNEYETELSGQQYFELMNSQNPVENLIDTLYENVTLPTQLKKEVKQQALEEIQLRMEEQNLSEQDFFFALGFSSLINDRGTYYSLLKLYRNGDVEVTPKTISMKFISYIPTGIFNNVAPENSTIEQ